MIITIIIIIIIIIKISLRVLSSRIYTPRVLLAHAVSVLLTHWPLGDTLLRTVGSLPHHYKALYPRS
jgi:hypothetical protein